MSTPRNFNHSIHTNIYDRSICRYIYIDYPMSSYTSVLKSIADYEEQNLCPLLWRTERYTVYPIKEETCTSKHKRENAINLICNSRQMWKLVHLYVRSLNKMMLSLLVLCLVL